MLYASRLLFFLLVNRCSDKRRIKLCGDIKMIHRGRNETRVLISPETGTRITILINKLAHALFQHSSRWRDVFLQLAEVVFVRYKERRVWLGGRMYVNIWYAARGMAVTEERTRWEKKDF